MDEETSFAPRSVLGPRRSGRNGLAILVPALALVATVWAGLSGARPDEDVARVPDGAAVVVPTIQGAPSSSADRAADPLGSQRPGYPAQVVGLNVQRLDDVQPRWLGRDEVVALAGWYVATAITDCPRIVVIRRQGSLPEIRRDIDHLAYCDRSGVLYASRPDLDDRLPRSNFEDNRSKNAGLPAVGVELVVGVVMPPELEIVGTTATPVVFVGRFVASGEGCLPQAGCPRRLVVDHVAWAKDL
jgi:hypothetical protein